MRVLIETLGSHGDVFPFVALGIELQRRGHEVRLYANAFYERYASAAGIHFTATSSREEYEAILNAPTITDKVKAMKLVADATTKSILKSYATMRADIVPGQTIAIASSFAFAAHLLHEIDRVPTAVIHLAPTFLRSEYLASRVGVSDLPQWTPRFLKRFKFWLMDKLLLDKLFATPFNGFRASLGLPPVERMLHRWVHATDLTLAMFPDWFAPRQPDWPGNLEITGFPLYDHGGEQPLSDELRNFLDAGPPPVAFTAGTANARSHSFYAESAEACRLAGVRGILVTQHAEQLPASLPEGVMHCHYVPFNTLLPKLAAFVHHGGIGTVAQALRAGVPQLIRPMAFDQFDNADRAMRLGVAREILPRQYLAATVAQLLGELVHDGAVKARCQKHAEILGATNQVATTCDILLKRLGVDVSHLAGH